MLFCKRLNPLPAAAPAASAQLIESEEKADDSPCPEFRKNLPGCKDTYALPPRRRLGFGSTTS